MTIKLEGFKLFAIGRSGVIGRSLLSLLLFVCYFLPRYGYADVLSGDLLCSPDGFLCHFLYPFSHANVFHLLGNVLCLWMFRCRLNIVLAYIIAVICSFIPCFTSEPTMGFSGVLFGIAGMSWGRIGRFGDMCRKCLPFLLLTFLVPHMNVFIHLYCLMFGYFVGRRIIKE